jgi:hypothetical protein
LFPAPDADFNASSAAINTLLLKFIGMWHDTGKGKRDYFLNGTEEFELCSWAWTKKRHKKISSIARFRYALVSSFNDEVNDRFSNSRVGPLLEGPLEGDIRLGDD